MSDTGRSGVLYTEYPRLRAHTPLLSLRAYRAWGRESGRQAVGHRITFGADEGEQEAHGD
jgi:hypothetical protein